MKPIKQHALCSSAMFTVCQFYHWLIAQVLWSGQTPRLVPKFATSAACSLWEHICESHILLFFSVKDMGLGQWQWPREASMNPSLQPAGQQESSEEWGLKDMSRWVL